VLQIWPHFSAAMAHGEEKLYV